MEGVSMGQELEMDDASMRRELEMEGISILPASESDRQPWGEIRESGWTYFGCILFIVILFMLFHLKYEKKVIRRPKNLKKSSNSAVLQAYLLAQEKAAHTILPRGRQQVADFLKQCGQRRKHPVIFKIEFSSGVESLAAGGEQAGVTAANHPDNLAKNRSAEVIPFDDSRVVCAGLVEGWDYIVTQGTLDTTLVDFWAMVWQEQVPVIVMLTKTFDYIRVMCAQYWPASLRREEEYSSGQGPHFYVSVREEVHYASYIRRRMVVRLGQERRQVDHYQYTEWPCYSSPANVALRRFRAQVAAAWREVEGGAGTGGGELEGGRRPAGPCLVHCHDGGGRSGVFVAMDANIRLAGREGQLDVFSYLGRMRQARPGLVANQEQYRLVYSLLEEQLEMGDTTSTVQDLRTAAGKDLSGEFSLVNRVLPRLSQGDCAGGHRLDNRSKNRSVAVLPPDAHRPYITSFQGNDCTDYINAVFVSGHTQANDFIVTEWPLANTLQNFWSMVYDHEVTTVVVLDSPRTSNKYPAFWPHESDRPKKFGPVFTVEKVEGKEAAGAGFSSYSLHLCKKEVAPHRKTQSLYVDDKQVSSLTNLVVGVTAPARHCQVLQLHSWGQDCLPHNLAQLLGAARAHRAASNPESPVVVVSADGAERAGVYCTASHCLDQLQREKEVDCVHAVHCVRLARPQLVPSLEEYELVYRVLAAVVSEASSSQS